MFAVAALEAVGVPPVDAGTTADRLIEADLKGRDGHGVIRLLQYVPRLRAGGMNAEPNIQVVRESPVSALIDGDNGLGQVVMTFATELAVDKARGAGMAWVGTVHSNHAGAAGVYTSMALARDLIAIYMAVASANVMPPWGGTRRLLGTNPVSIAIPADEHPGFLLDIATTVASHGTIQVMAMNGEEMPEGWVVDEDGNPIVDPRRADEGYLMPIGGHKGSGLNVAFGLLAGVLNGAAFGRDVIDHRSVPDEPANTGQAIFVLNPDLLRETNEFEAAVDAALSELRSSGAEGAVRIPGERAFDLERDRMAAGLPLTDGLAARLEEMGRELGIDERLVVV
jgi:L-2-hydroxycarboxylate dehydrogenase (NAD+)